MEDLCTACLCSGRKLHFIGETGSYHLYSQILTEIPVYELSLCVRVCWECRERLRRFREFKALVKASYTSLLHHLHQPSEAPLARPPRLQVRSLAGYSFPEYLVAAVKQEQDDDVDCVEDVEVQLKPLKEESVHSEPEAQAFPATHRTRKKRTTKKTNKESTKKKVKSKTKKLEEKKINSKKKPENGRSSPEEFKVTDDAISDRDPDPGDTEDDMVLEEMRERKYRVVTKRKQTEADRVGAKRGEDEGGDKEGVQPAEGRKPNGVRSRDRSPLMVGEKPTCAECGKMFSSKKTYRYHLNVLHKGQNRYPCPRCGKVYQWKSNLGRHLRTHKARDSGELYCATCDKRFASVATYRQHLRVSRRHVPESEFSFTCQECGKKFVNKTRLRDHIDWDHLHKIKFRCQLCNKPFKCHTSLYVHLQNVHKNKEKENLCHICGKSYQNAAKLKYHIVAMHTSETPYRCAHCAAAFGWYSSLYRHVREVHYKMKLQPKRIRKAKRPETLPPPQPPPHM